MQPVIIKALLFSILSVDWIAVNLVYNQNATYKEGVYVGQQITGSTIKIPQYSVTDDNLTYILFRTNQDRVGVTMMIDGNITFHSTNGRIVSTSESPREVSTPLSETITPYNAFNDFNTSNFTELEIRLDNISLDQRIKNLFLQKYRDESLATILPTIILTNG
uniref:Uncharacterized protein n=1 Tax=Abalone asfa-like virus TaxID=2839893 RepID=A0A5K7Y0W8_9VIRU|nr:hypothetical protein [Abalone asfa-like virus]BCY04591.1 hypothetical protein [Abalone asfa-like virus]